MTAWTYRLLCLALFLAAMAGLRAGLQALKETHDAALAWTIAVPVVAGCIAFGFWYDRRGY